jgi:hypothetical protein
VAVFVHAAILFALRPAVASAPRAPELDVPAVRASLRTERAALLATAEADVAAPDPTERERALAAYRAMLADVRAAVTRGEPAAHAIADAVARDGHAGRYERMYPRLADALANGGGNCVALSTLAASLTASLAHDAGARHDADGAGRGCCRRSRRARARAR